MQAIEFTSPKLDGNATLKGAQESKMYGIPDKIPPAKHRTVFKTDCKISVLLKAVDIDLIFCVASVFII